MLFKCDAKVCPVLHVHGHDGQVHTQARVVQQNFARLPGASTRQIQVHVHVHVHVCTCSLHVHAF